jgi:HK97 gp10 family phage protein
MSDFFTFEVKGLKEMGDQLAQLPGKIARRALAAAVREGANVIRTAGRQAAPVGTKTYKDWKGRIHRPGLLRKSGVITKKMRPKDWQSTVLFGVGFRGRGYYGRWVERGKSKKHRQAPHPFLVPAFEAKGEEAIQAIKRRLGEELVSIIHSTPGMRVK